MPDVETPQYGFTRLLYAHFRIINSFSGICQRDIFLKVRVFIALSIPSLD